MPCGIYQRPAKRGRYHLRKPNKGWFKSQGKHIIAVCLVCGIEFKYYESLRKQAYCSTACFHRSRVGVKRPRHSLLMKSRCKVHNPLAQFWGRRLSDKEKRDISERMLKRWADKQDYFNSQEYRQSISDRNVALGKVGRGVSTYNRGYARGLQGTYVINGKSIFFRSSWEANYALYLDFLIRHREIKSWEFEKDTFWFEKIRRGVRSYKPDFKVFRPDGGMEYHEVKGWMDKKSATKLRRMKKYYPNVKVILVDAECYKDIKRKLGRALGFF